MIFEEAMLHARSGGKIRRPVMGECYMTFIKVPISKDEEELSLVFVTGHTVSKIFNLLGSDISADDWVDADPIVPVKMYHEGYYVKCPKCNRRYSAGMLWKEKVGDLYKCSCGNRLLLEPPEGTGHTVDTNSKDAWPVAVR